MLREIGQTYYAPVCKLSKVESASVATTGEKISIGRRNAFS